MEKQAWEDTRKWRGPEVSIIDLKVEGKLFQCIQLCSTGNGQISIIYITVSTVMMFRKLSGVPSFP